MYSGRLFQMRGPATEKTQMPTVDTGQPDRWNMKTVRVGGTRKKEKGKKPLGDEPTTVSTDYNNISWKQV